MKKFLILCAVMFFGAKTMQAQVSDKEFYGVLNHLGADINVGSQGIGIDLAMPVTKWAELSIGLNTMPAIKYSDDISVGNFSADYLGQTYYFDGKEVGIKANFERTTGDLKLSLYPFGGNNDLFITGGFSFGGNEIAKIHAHSAVVNDFYHNPNFADNNGTVIPAQAKDAVKAEIDKYNIDFDENGDARGTVKVRKFRPYVGLGWGRLVPKKSVGFRVEAGVQFMGKMKLYQNGKEIKADDITPEDDTLSDIIEKVKVYPVLKFSLTTRLF